MALHKIRKGLDLPITGAPAATLEDARTPRRVALLGSDYVGMRPTLHVRPGETVRRGQLVFEDKKTPGVRFTAPAAGRVAAVHRGERRAFLSLAIELAQGEIEGRAGNDVTFRSHLGKHPSALNAEQVRELLLESGQWTALRRRPFSRVAFPGERPHSIFVTALDTHPLAPPTGPLLEGREEDFEQGLVALAKLTDGPVYVCTGADDRVELPAGDRFRLERFTGPHPAGTAGLHIHTLDPVHREKVVWHLGLQDVVATGHLFRTGRLMVERIVALGGPPVANPRLLRTRLGASLDDLVEGEVEPAGGGEATVAVAEEGAEPAPPYRVLSGSVLDGRAAMGEAVGYLGRYHQQISVLREDRERRLLGWLAPGWNQYSAVRTFISKLAPNRRFDLTTSSQGSRRAIVPIGVYEKVMPLDLMATALLRSLAVADVEAAERLGALELDEEDLALVSFVCPGKSDFGPMLRKVLTTIEKEG